MQVAVIGTGYLGTTHAACMSHLGHNVLGVDISEEKVAKLQSGEVPFFEPDLEGLVRENLTAGRLRFSASHEEAADFADVIFLAVGTPQSTTGLRCGPVFRRSGDRCLDSSPGPTLTDSRKIDRAGRYGSSPGAAR